MMLTKETVYTEDVAGKKIKVVREFDAPVQKVWDYWTRKELLDQWWAPRPWKAVTESLDLRDGGRWLYYMQGPEGERHYAKVEYTKVNPGKSFSGIDAFADEKGNTLDTMPNMGWDVRFTPVDDRTRVEVDITFKSEEDMRKIVEMGFKDGFAAGHNNLDELLEREG